MDSFYNYDDIRNRINNLFNHSTDSQKKEKARNLQTKFEVTLALLTLANSFPASSIVNNPTMDISNILEGIGKIFKHDQTGINETLQLLAGKRMELYQIMEKVVEELEKLEEKDNDIFDIFSLPLQSIDKTTATQEEIDGIVTKILKSAGIGIMDKNNEVIVINQEKVDMLVQAGLDNNMSKALTDLGIDLSEWDEFIQGTILEDIYIKLLPVSTLNKSTTVFHSSAFVPETDPVIIFEHKEEEQGEQGEQEEKREKMKKILALLTLKEKSRLINDTFDGKEDIATFLLSVQNASQIQDILSETEKPEEIMCLISGGCYQSITDDLFNNLDPEEKMLLAQGEKIEIKCRSIKNETVKECIIDMVKTLCKEEMKTLSIDQFCDGLLKLLTKREKTKIAHEGVDIKDILNLEPNSYYQFMFDKLGASEIQNTIYPKCWTYLEEHKDDSLIQQYLLVPGKKNLRNFGKEFIDGAKNIVRAITNSFRTKKETNDEISETLEPTPLRRTEFFNSLRTSLKPNPKITVAKDTPLRKFLRRAKTEVKTIFDGAVELYYNLREPYDDIDDGFDIEDD